MKYPMKEVMSPFGGTTYEEMTHQEYEERLNWFKDYMETHQNETSKSMQGYVSYLRQWFSDSSCDGLPDYKTRYMFHKLPMSSNVYLFH